MEDFAPLEDLQPPIVLRARGKEYTLPTIMWEQGVALQKRIAAGDLTVSTLTEELLGRELIERLDADSVPIEFIAHCGSVALADWKFGREIAKAVWADPKLLTTLIEAMGQAPATPQAEATTTPRPASGSGTRSPSKRKGNRSRGRRS